MSAPHATTTGSAKLAHASRVLKAARASLEAVRLSRPSGHLPTQEELFPALAAVCRELTDHLSAYAISAATFDEDAFIAVEKAERLLFDAALASSLPTV